MLFSEGDKNLRGTLLGRNFSRWGEGMNRFLAIGGPHPPSSGNPSVGATLICTLIHIHLPILSWHIQPIGGMWQRQQAYTLL